MGILDVYEKKPSRSVFPLSHNNLFSIQDFGVLYPILMKPAIPGDVFKHQHSVSLQFQPMFANVNHRFRIMTYYFFVPNRIIWPKWDEFMAGNPNDPQPIHPFMYHENMFKCLAGGLEPTTQHTEAALRHGSLADYIGLPTLPWNNGYPGSFAQSDSVEINSLPFRAYQKVWEDYFRDEQQVGPAVYQNYEDSGAEQDYGGSYEVPPELLYLRAKAWNKDPFTTSLIYRTAGNYTPTLSGSFTIEDFRNASSLTKFFERMMRAGTRPKEFLHATFGVKPKDYRLDMPEFLCASSSDVVMGQILNGEASSGTDAAAQGYAVSTARSSSIAGGFRYKCTEFGWYVGLLCLVPDSVYFKGLPNYLTNIKLNTDYPFPDFAKLGDQAIRSREVNWIVPDTATDVTINNTVFGYAPRYWEYKYYPNEVHGQFRDAAFEMYHDARMMDTYTPSRQLNFVYVEEAHAMDGSATDKDRLKRIFAVTEGAFIATCNVFHSISALRPLPYSSVPRIVG